MSRVTQLVLGGVTACVVAASSATPSLAAGSRAHTRRQCQHALIQRQRRLPKTLALPAPGAITTALGVLREPPATAAQLSSGVIGRLGTAFWSYSGLWTGAARTLWSGPLVLGGTGVPRQVTYFVVPGVVGTAPLPHPCQKLLSKKQRRRFHEAERHIPHGPVVSFGWFTSEIDVAFPFTISEVTRGEATQFDPESASVYGLVPDGVASVGVVLDGQTLPSAQVGGNFFRAPTQGLSPGTHTLVQLWYAPDGAVLQRLNEKVRIAKATKTS